VPIVVISAGAGYSRTGTGWATQASGGYDGGPFDYTATPGDAATFTFTLTAPGVYRLAIAYVADTNRSTAVGLVVKDGTTTILSRTLDQTVSPSDFGYNGAGFAWLGAGLTFATTSASVTLTAPGTTYTIADAVYLADATAPTPGMSTFAKATNYNDLLPPITLASAHAAGASTLILSAGAGASNRLGTLGANRIFRVTALQSPGTAAEQVLGIYEATGISGDTLTGVSGAEGFGNVALPAGTAIEERPTEKGYEEHSTAINAAEVTIPLRALDSAVVHRFGDEVIGGRKSFSGSIQDIRFLSLLGGTFVAMPTTGPSGIGTSTSNPFAAYCDVDGAWLFDSHAGDIAHRNTSGNLLFGTAVGNSTFGITTDGIFVVAPGPLKAGLRVIAATAQTSPLIRCLASDGTTELASVGPGGSGRFTGGVAGPVNANAFATERFGKNAAPNVTGDFNTIFGSGAAPDLTSGVLNTIVGLLAAQGLTTGAANLILGSQSTVPAGLTGGIVLGSSTAITGTGSNVISVGSSQSISHNNVIALAAGAVTTQSGQLVTGQNIGAWTMSAATSLQSRPACEIQRSLIVTADGSYTARMVVGVYDAGGFREAFRAESDGAQAITTLSGTLRVASNALPLPFSFGGRDANTVGNDLCPRHYVSYADTVVRLILSTTAVVSGTFTVRVMRSSDGGSTFPDTVGSVSLAAGNRGTTTTTIATPALAAGDWLRCDITAISGTVGGWMARLSILSRNQ
jgi:hypothetical protein